MKKISLFLSAAVALCVASCDEAPDVAPMQENPQEPVLAEGDVKGAAAGVLTSAEDVVALEDYRDNPQIEVFRFTEVADLPEGAAVECDLELSSSEDFANVKTVPVSVTDGTGYANVNDWQAAHIALFGKSPKEKTVYWRVPVYVSAGDTRYRYSSDSYYAASGSLTETCMDAGFVIYEAYYFVSDVTEWSFVEDCKFSHSDADVYDDPVFTFRFSVTQEFIDSNANGGTYWKIGSQEAANTGEWKYTYGPETNGDTSLSGMLDGGDHEPGAGFISEAGNYRITINMEEMTYSIELLTRPDYIAVPSNANGWTESGSWLYWSNKDDKPYFCGAACVNNTDGGFKFIWDGNWYGDGGAAGVLAGGNAGNILAPLDETAFYWFTVSTDNMTYTITPITSVGVIGCNNDWANVLQLTQGEELLVWSGDIELSGEWKIIINGDWAMNYGGPDLANPTFDGGNFSGFEGLHTVTIDFTDHHPVITVVAK